MNNKPIKDRYVAYFLTTNDVKDCRVCGWGLMNCANAANVRYGSNLDEFMKTLKSLGTPYVYLPNLSFDGSFLMDYLLKNNYTYNTGYRNSFTSKVTCDNVYYSLDIYFTSKKTNPLIRSKILDYRKLINMEISKAHQKFRVDLTKFHFNLEEKKEIAKRLNITESKITLLQNSLATMRESLKSLFDLGLTNHTISSCALNDFIAICGGSKNFKHIFPLLSDEIDAYCREAYRGGYVFLNTAITSKPLGCGLVLDINSLYSYVMSTKPMPKGNPIHFKGRPNPTPDAPLFIARVRCSLELKDDGIPTLQIKRNPLFDPTKYVTSTEGQTVVLTLTSVDLKLMIENYDVANFEWIDGYAFKQSDKKFKRYVEKWTEIKIEAGKTNNAGMRQSAKLMLNGLGGKFGTKTKFAVKSPLISEDEILGYGDIKEQEVKSVYTPVAAFMTAYGREILINTIRANRERAAYGDTDSLHLLGLEPPKGIKIDDYELGAWKVEHEFTKAKYIKSKTYIIEDVNGKLIKHIAGMPEDDMEQITFENFGLGSVYTKYVKQKVAGGAVLMAKDHEIK